MELVLFEVTEGIATVTLNRPESLNAMSVELTAALSEVFTKLTGMSEVRSVILTGTGRAFSSGGDIKQMAALTTVADLPSRIYEALLAYNQLICAIRDLPKPVVAAVNGVAIGAGFNLALACDVRIAVESATFSQAFVRLGLIPDCGGTFFLPRIVGLAKAFELMLTGETLTAMQAKELGVVNLVVSEAQLMLAAREFAMRMAMLPTATIGRLKKLLDASFSHSLQQQLSLEAQFQAECASSQDFSEGVRAFLEKRPPKFVGY
ncbi:MAG: enoyl-CoA hydratase-related protein [Acidobacteriota bacterium]|nr:enoyl-CoA hydratase-related protein [Blastocatellia bacterium]MDW8412079.1 enoyl-CoA hydratase-related protein [Acidobacteriota bacterium]